MWNSTNENRRRSTHYAHQIVKPNYTVYYGKEDKEPVQISDYRPGTRTREIKLVAGVPVNVAYARYTQQQLNDFNTYEYGYKMLRKSGCGHSQAINQLMDIRRGHHELLCSVFKTCSSLYREVPVAIRKAS